MKHVFRSTLLQLVSKCFIIIIIIIIIIIVVVVVVVSVISPFIYKPT